MARAAVQAGAAVQVSDVNGFAREATRLLMDTQAALRMGEAGLAFCVAHRGALERVLALIEIPDPPAVTPTDERIRPSQ